MVKGIIITTLLIPTLILGQKTDKQKVVEKGLLRSQAIISFGKLLDLEQTSMFIHGNAEYHISAPITFRSDIFYYLQSDDANGLSMNHQLFEGATYHIITKSNFDPYIGFQPGLGLSKSKTSLLVSDAPAIESYSKTSVNPLISGVIGFNYYATKFFHLFVDLRYILGTHLSDVKPVSLNEVRISFGLGLNLNLIKLFK